jgi:phosphate uptake regulator
MILVARQIERYADHAVDIAEQTVFAVTGRFVELSSNAPIGSRK